MENNSESKSQSSSSESWAYKYWIRSEEPTEGWWPWGILPLLIALGLLLFGLIKTAPDVVQAETKAGVEKQLSALGYDNFSVKADGQEVDVTGEGKKEDEAKLVAQLQGTLCDSWAGELVCPTHVNVNLKESSAPIKEARFHDVTWIKKEDSLLIKGEVPNKEIKKLLLEEAHKVSDKVTDELVISNDAVTDGYSLAYTRAAQVLTPMLRGEAHWIDGVFSARGWVHQDDYESTKNLFSVADNAPNLGEIILFNQDEVDRCNVEFQNALKKSTIRFQTGKAIISPTSKKLLAKLAELALACPGNLDVEGHTDNVGDADANQVLSEARAKAVADALTALNVPAERLEPKGYGEMKPIADNSKAEGRAKNRRIEIKINNK